MIKLTKADFKRFAPNAKPQYVDALFANLPKLQESGVLDSKLRWAHFIGQVAAETDSLVILRESLDYRTVRAIRNAWGSRASKLSDEWIESNLLRNPVALGDWAYGGRMGNRKGTTDGFNGRGGGWLQTTGMGAVRDYCKRCGMEPRDDVLDDVGATLEFALLEWAEGKCNAYADKDDVLAISKIINTGSATSGVKPNGLDRRRQEVAKALKIWSDPTEVEPEPTRLYAEPAPAPSAVSQLASMGTSKTMWSAIALFAQGMFGWVEKALNSIFDMITQAGTDFDSLMAPLASLSTAAKVNIAGITTVIMVACLLRVVFKYQTTKNAAQTATQGE
jgi:putative chitinase